MHVQLLLLLFYSYHLTSALLLNKVALIYPQANDGCLLFGEDFMEGISRMFLSHCWEPPAKANPTSRSYPALCCFCPVGTEAMKWVVDSGFNLSGA